MLERRIVRRIGSRPAVVRVFVDENALAAGSLRLVGDAARHVGGALRVRPGELIVAVTPDAIEHTCEVETASPGEVRARVVASHPSAKEPGRHVRVCQALLKG